jgi:hypothetical protein
MTSRLRHTLALASSGLLLAGCAGDGNYSFGSGTSNVTTSAVAESPKTDPACVTLATQIDALRGEGVADKVANAATKKYKMTQADFAKADQLNRANSDFQARCSTLPRRPAPATAVAPAPAPAAAVVAPAAAKAATSAAPAKAAPARAGTAPAGIQAATTQQ